MISARICFFIILAEALLISPTPVQNPFSFVPALFTENSQGIILNTELAKGCPWLWTNTTTELQANVRSGFLGSREELKQVCQQDEPTAALICQTAGGLVNYICSSAQKARYYKVMSEVNISASAICSAFQNETFLFKLEEAALQSTGLPRNQTSNLIHNSTDSKLSDCEQLCDSSLRLCQIILQSLKMIANRNELSTTASSSSVTVMTTTANVKLKKLDEKTSEQGPLSHIDNKDGNSLNILSEDEFVDEMEKPDTIDEDQDLTDNEELESPNKTINDGIVSTPTKPSQSYDSQSEIDEDPVNTHFIFYFLAFVVLSVCGYLLYQRRYRIVALVLEGRNGSSSRRRGRSSRSRGSSGSYHKLVNNLEEAITSHSVNNSNVVY